MDKIKCMEAFIRVVESGSLAKAASQMHLSKSTITIRVQQLEELIGAALFHRGIRYVSLTKIGDEYYKECVDLLSRIDELTDKISHHRKLEEGRLRIHMTPNFALHYFGQFSARFIQKYPEIELDLVVNDEIVDPISSGFDLIFQTVPPSYDNLIEKKIFSVNKVLCASEKFLQKSGFPLFPQDLKNYQIAGCLQHGLKNHLKFFMNHNFQEIILNTKFFSSSAHILQDYAIHHGGIVCLPTLIAYQSLLNGQLVPLLQDYPILNDTLRAVYSPGSRYDSKLRVFLDNLVKDFQHLPEWDIKLIEKNLLSEKVKKFSL
ncbi:LysR family transcriptional regulator [Acinetobacter baumannii]